jgi:signal transduction histidine kinase
MFKITARTVLELGSELISSDIIAFYELIKNGFDAGTKSGVQIDFNVVLRRNAFLTLRDAARGGVKREEIVQKALENLNHDAPEELLNKAQAIFEQRSDSRESFIEALEEVYNLSTIVVSDRGKGMSRSDLAKNFLVIGTASRKREVQQALIRGDTKSPYLGEKGIGRLSAMRLGESLRVESATADDRYVNVLDIDWSAFSDIDAMLEDIHIQPERGGPKQTADWSGTRIVIGALTEDWTEKRVRRMAEYDFARLSDPFVDQKRRPRIALYWNAERIAIPWMEKALLDSSHAHVSGSYDIVDGEPVLNCTVAVKNLGFPHPIETETTKLQSVDLQAALIGTTSDLPVSSIASVGPFNFEIYWFNRRLLRAIDGIGELKAVRDLQERWSGILLFRDGFRVFPYGDDEDDWLGLDRKALRRSGYTLNKTQFVGRVEISRVANPALVDQTNREGLRETPEQQVLIEVMQLVIQDQLFRFMKQIERQYKDQPVDLIEAKTEVDNLNKRSKAAIAKLRRLAPDGKPEIDELQQTLFEFSEFADKARQRIEEVERESKQMIDMAGVGLMVEVVAHELARASEAALENLEILRDKTIPEDIRSKLSSLRAQMKSLSKRVRVLDPLSVSGRQTAETFDLQLLVEETLDAHEAQFGRHRIKTTFKHLDSPVRIKVVKGMIVQILENLISNSKYWMEMRASKERNYAPRITITLSDRPPTIVYEDNGPGIAPENRERIFRSFVSFKEKSKRRGLGLFIARACAEQIGGTLILDDHVSKETGRLHRFTLELPESSAVK